MKNRSLVLASAILVAIATMLGGLAAGADRPLQKVADDCSAIEINPKQWKLQCQDNQWALFCDKKGEEKKCACRKGAKYYQTYGSHCDENLPCYKKKCI